MARNIETRSIAINRATAIVASFRPVFGFPAIIVVCSDAVEGVFVCKWVLPIRFWKFAR